MCSRQQRQQTFQQPVEHCRKRTDTDMAKLQLDSDIDFGFRFHGSHNLLSSPDLNAEFFMSIPQQKWCWTLKEQLQMAAIELWSELWCLSDRLRGSLAAEALLHWNFTFFYLQSSACTSFAHLRQLLRGPIVYTHSATKEGVQTVILWLLGFLIWFNMPAALLVKHHDGISQFKKSGLKMV